MSRRLLTGNAAAAWGARLAGAEYIPAFPITPQTEIIETLARWIEQGEMPGRLVTMDSEQPPVPRPQPAFVSSLRRRARGCSTRWRCSTQWRVGARPSCW